MFFAREVHPTKRTASSIKEMREERGDDFFKYIDT